MAHSSILGIARIDKDDEQEESDDFLNSGDFDIIEIVKEEISNEGEISIAI